MSSLLRRIGRLVRSAAGSPAGSPTRTRSRTAPAGRGGVRITYSPASDGEADPGEVVWAWVPFEEDDGRGKDRPVLVVAREGSRLVALPMTSQDNTRDADREARFGRYCFDVGSGPWDSRGRPSEVRLDRVLRLDPASVRREGARLDRGRFDAVAAELRRLHGWG